MRASTNLFNAVEKKIQNAKINLSQETLEEIDLLTDILKKCISYERKLIKQNMDID